MKAKSLIFETYPQPTVLLMGKKVNQSGIFRELDETERSLGPVSALSPTLEHPHPTDQEPRESTEAPQNVGLSKEGERLTGAETRLEQNECGLISEAPHKQ